LRTEVTANLLTFLFLKNPAWVAIPVFVWHAVNAIATLMYGDIAFVAEDYQVFLFVIS
jgi:hypothetical protein